MTRRYVTTIPQAQRSRPDGVQGGSSKSSITTTTDPSVARAPVDDLDAVGELDQVAYDEHMEQMVSTQLDLLRAADEAKRRLAAERSGRAPIPQVIPLRAFLDTPDEEAAYRIDGVFPLGSRIMLAAQYKAGKTTFLANMVRSLVDGDPFLGRFEVQPVGRVVLIDDEMDERTLRRWLRTQGIRNTSKVGVVSLRAKTSSMDLLDASVRSQWARMLHGADVVILDCLRPVLDALGLDENHDAGRFLTAFDELLAAAGVPEAVVSHHMGHSGERGRGDSRLLDWPDANWKLLRHGQNTDDDDPSAPRYFSAYGRDVEVPEAVLQYAPDTRRLTLGDGSRKDARREALISIVVDYVSAHPGESKTAIRERVEGENGAVGKAIDAAVDRGFIERRPGTRGPNSGVYHPTRLTRLDPSQDGS